MISNSLLTNEQECFINILSSVGCMSEAQARHILYNYLGVRGNSVRATLSGLSLRRLIKTTRDGKFLTPGGLAFNEVVNRNMIECIAVMNSVYDQWIAKHSDAVSDVRENINFVFRPHSEFELSFIAEAESYQLIHIPSNQLFRMNVVATKMKEQEKALSKTVAQGLNVLPFTVFIFSAGVDKNAILQKVDSMELDIPHKLVFMKGKELEGNISFDVYG